MPETLGQLFEDSSDHGSAYFVPICLYTHNLTQREPCRRLIEEFIRRDASALMVIADGPHAYNLQLRGYRPETAARRARIAGMNLHNMLHNVMKQTGGANLQASQWEPVFQETRCQALFGDVERAFTMIPDLREIAERFIRFQARRAEWSPQDSTHALEWSYLTEEVTMSIYATEIRGYSCEFWEDERGPTSPDPLGHLYTNHPELVRAWVNKDSLSRKLFRLPASW